MSETYFIRGTITIRAEGDEVKIGITPCAGFLTPDKPYQAIAFPVKKTRYAKLIELQDEKKFECDAKVKVEYIPALLVIAAQQKPVELRLEVAALEIVGFVFPTP
jgi:hypothetical protein